MAAPIAFEDELNAEQLAAATAPDGALLILAAAGTGKTRTLVYRVACLVQRGVSPESILLLTFTNRAAREMLERARSLLGTTAGVSWSGTFHHVANRLLRRYAHLLDYRPDYTILDRDDSKTLMGDCIKELKLHGSEFPKKEVLLAIAGKAANMQRSFTEVTEGWFGDEPVDPEAVVRVLDRYTERKHGISAMDFDDLLVNCLKLLQAQPRVEAYWQEHFQHVLVDEYQDTNTIQAQIVDRLGGRHRNVFVVGDDFQSIYSWRGADYRNIITFPERYPEAVMYKLETNYRSVSGVLDIANTTVSMADHPEAFKRTLRATRPAGPHRPLVARVRDGQGQAQFAVEQIQRMRRDGARYRDIAVLYRAHYHAIELQLALTRARIPHEVTSGIRFFEQAHIKDVLALLRVLVMPLDELAFGRLLALLPGVGRQTVLRIWTRLGLRFEAADPGQRAELAGMLRPQGRARWALIEPILAAYTAEGLQQDPGEVVSRFLDAFYRQYALDTFENGQERIEDVTELVTHAASVESTERFLSDVALLSNLDAEVEAEAGDGDHVRLSTVHQAKGLEWPAVILLWMTEGMFPSARSISDSDEGEAEERRLFYVAVTRARDELIFAVPESRRMRDGGQYPCTPSRFLSELPPGLVTARRIDSW